jgi:hypothetical protein
MSEVLVGFACPADRADDLRLGENLAAHDNDAVSSRPSSLSPDRVSSVFD